MGNCKKGGIWTGAKMQKQAILLGLNYFQQLLVEIQGFILGKASRVEIGAHESFTGL